MAHTYIVGKSLVCRTERGFGMRSRFFFASPYTCASTYIYISLHTHKTLYKRTHTHEHLGMCMHICCCCKYKSTLYYYTCVCPHAAHSCASDAVRTTVKYNILYDIRLRVGGFSSSSRRSIKVYIIIVGIFILNQIEMWQTRTTAAATETTRSRRDDDGRVAFRKKNNSHNV